MIIKTNSKSLMNYFIFTWDVKQFTFGFLFGIIISLIYNSAMYLSVSNYATRQTLQELKEFDSFFKTNFSLNKNLLIEPQRAENQLSDSKCGYSQKGPRILCTVFTYKKSFNLKAKYVEKTWGKRCDKTIFMSGRLSEEEKEQYSHMDIIYLNVTDTNRLNLTTKTIETLLYANNYLIDQFDWILKADDDTYVIMENLRKFLQDKCSDEMNYYGFRYKPLAPDSFDHDFNSGGAGYVISNKALRTFSHKYINDETFCRNITGSEDVDIAKCLSQIKVLPGDSRDENGLERFHPLSYESMWNISPDKRTYHHSRFPLKRKEECCSRSSISFHYTSGEKALQLDYLLYKLKSE